VCFGGPKPLRFCHFRGDEAAAALGELRSTQTPSQRVGSGGPESSLRRRPQGLCAWRGFAPPHTSFMGALRAPCEGRNPSRYPPRKTP
jgi:hypothetical protein